MLHISFGPFHFLEHSLWSWPWLQDWTLYKKKWAQFYFFPLQQTSQRLTLLQVREDVPDFFSVGDAVFFFFILGLQTSAALI